MSMKKTSDVENIIYGFVAENCQDAEDPEDFILATTIPESLAKDDPFFDYSHPIAHVMAVGFFQAGQIYERALATNVNETQPLPEKSILEKIDEFLEARVGADADAKVQEISAITTDCIKISEDLLTDSLLEGYNSSSVKDEIALRALIAGAVQMGQLLERIETNGSIANQYESGVS